jgi:hypothetical protein
VRGVFRRVAAVFLSIELAVRAGADDAPRWLRFVARHLAGGALGLLVGGGILVSMLVQYPQYVPWPLYVLYFSVSFASGVVGGVMRRKRRRMRRQDHSVGP